MSHRVAAGGARRPERRAMWRWPALIAATTVFALTLTASHVADTSASWNDAEWVSASGAIGTIDCSAGGTEFTSQSEGRMLSGSALGLDTGTLADVTRVTTVNDGVSASATPASAMPATPPDAFSNPLRVDLLNAALGLDLSGILQLPLDTDLGLVGQFAQARNTGEEVGASGLLTNTGSIDLSGGNGDAPTIATLRLSQLLNSLGYNLGTAVGDSTVDVGLEIGAVAGRASLVDPCAAAWAGNLETAVSRDYLAAGVDTVIESQLVRNLGSAVPPVLSGLESSVNAIVGSEGAISQIVTSVVGIVGGVVSLLGLNTARVKPNATTATVAVDLDFTEVNELLSAPLQDDGGVLSIDLLGGTVTIDTAALLEKTYPGQYSNGLNGLDPNTSPLDDPAVLQTLLSSINDLLASWIGELNTAIDAALAVPMVTVHLGIPIQQCTRWVVACLEWSDLGTLGVSMTGTVAQLLAGQVTPTVTQPLPSSSVLGAVLTTLVSGILSGLMTTLGPLVGGIVDGALTTVRATVPGALDLVLNTAGAPVVALVSSVYSALYLDGVVALTLNAQNAPAAGDPGPHDWESLADGRFDVAAVRIGVLDAAQANAVWLYLARGSVQEPCVVGGSC